MFTDDARVADYKEWELNPSIQILVTDHLTFSAPHIDLNYGVLPNLQLKVEAPLLLDFKQNQSTEMSLGVLNFGIKYRFIDEEKYFVSGATFPQYNFTVDKGLLIPVFFEKTIGRVLFGIANAYFIGASNNDRYELGFLSGYRISERFHMMIEYFHVNNLSKPKSTNGLINLGFRREFNESLFLMGSFGREVLLTNPIEKTHFVSWIGIRKLF